MPQLSEDLARTSAQEEVAASVLVVDLDETLSRTDTLHEALVQLLFRNPIALCRIAFAGHRDKAAFKQSVADYAVIPAEYLVFNQDILDKIEQSRRIGQRVVLVSASDHRQVEEVANSIGGFDLAIGTGSTETERYNLAGRRKADFLVARYSSRQFDYIGDSPKDIPVWQVAHTAYATAPSSKLHRLAAAQGVTLTAIGTKAGDLRAYLKALRPHQWVKNGLIFLPLLAAQQFEMFWLAMIAFVLFSLTASSVYIFNDLADLSSDRIHPRKRARPLAAGSVPLWHGLVIGVGLLGISFIVSLLLMPLLFSIVLATYFAVTLAYSFSLKRKLIVDVIVLAGLYTMRIIAGGAATGIIPSPWLLAFSVFLFYSLASIKRQAELIDQASQKKETAPGRGYVASDVSIMQMISISSGQAAVLVFALYLYSPTVADLYTTPEVLWLICPVLLYWLSRIAILTHRGFMHDDPIVFAAKDKISLVTAMAVLLIVFLAEWGL